MNKSILVYTTQHMATGGIESHLQEFCMNFHRKGAEIYLVVLNSEMSDETKNFYTKICRQIYLGKNGSASSRFAWLFRIAIKLSIKRFDALYTNGQGESIFLFSKLLPFYKTWVHHHHTAGDFADQNTWPKSYRKALLSASSVVGCSTTNARDLQSALKRQVITIPCFSRAVAPVTKLHNRKLRFGYFGRLIPEKGIDRLCKLSEDPDLQLIEFHIWGEGKSYSPSYFEKFKQLQYHGAFEGHTELGKVVSSIDCFLLLSTHSEGLPICLLEVMSAGLPWLATDKGGIKDIAIDLNSTRIISSEASYLKIKAAIISLATDIEKGIVTKESQIKLYEENFSSTAIIAKWQKVLGID